MAEEKGGKTEKIWRWPPEDTRQHMRAARSELRESYKSLFPPEFVEHRRAARREMLLALRSLIDHALERMEAK
ncbi:MAG: hypothetical protein JSV37_02090 [Anaerolineaceae bacterium]|nr:MAG: hypothetical protein JSV37_02090 [Anaerolineaceae bacterium]